MSNVLPSQMGRGRILEDGDSTFGPHPKIAFTDRDRSPRRPPSPAAAPPLPRHGVFFPPPAAASKPEVTGICGLAPPRPVPACGLDGARPIWSVSQKLELPACRPSLGAALPPAPGRSAAKQCRLPTPAPLVFQPINRPVFCHQVTGARLMPPAFLRARYRHRPERPHQRH